MDHRGSTRSRWVRPLMRSASLVSSWAAITWVAAEVGVGERSFPERLAAAAPSPRLPRNPRRVIPPLPWQVLSSASSSFIRRILHVKCCWRGLEAAAFAPSGGRLGLLAGFGSSGSKHHQSAWPDLFLQLPRGLTPPVRPPDPYAA